MIKTKIILDLRVFWLAISVLYITLTFIGLTTVDRSACIGPCPHHTFTVVGDTIGNFTPVLKQGDEQLLLIVVVAALLKGSMFAVLGLIPFVLGFGIFTAGELLLRRAALKANQKIVANLVALFVLTQLSLIHI